METLLKTNIELLNDQYRKLTPVERIQQLYKDFLQKEVMVTSSFAATSALLLNLIHVVNKTQVIHFIDTGYHFKETLEYMKILSSLMDLKVQNIKADEWKHDFTTNDETWRKDPNLCCSINKVEPLDAVKNGHKIWVSGLMKWQSDHRESLDIFEERNGIIKFYPLLDVSKEERDKMIESSELPFHPLIAKGYQSIGCFHCTSPGENRAGRWNNNPKTECGLHL